MNDICVKYVFYMQCVRVKGATNELGGLCSCKASGQYKLRKCSNYSHSHSPNKVYLHQTFANFDTFNFFYSNYLSVALQHPGWLNPIFSCSIDQEVIFSLNIPLPSCIKKIAYIITETKFAPYISLQERSVKTCKQVTICRS